MLGVLWSLGLSGQGFEVLVDGRVPSGSGLSSSAALECAVATAVVELLGLGLTREQLVAACVRAENDYVGAPTGAMDQTVSVLAEPGAGPARGLRRPHPPPRSPGPPPASWS